MSERTYLRLFGLALGAFGAASLELKWLLYTSPPVAPIQFVLAHWWLYALYLVCALLLAWLSFRMRGGK